MRLMMLLILFFSIDSRAHSRAYSRDAEQKIEVLTYSKEYPIDQLKGRQYQKNKDAQKSPQDVLPPEMRDEILTSADLYSFISSWDQLERDLLVLRAQNSSLDALLKKYPALPKEGLLKLQQILKARKR